jgi:uncharacterized membrane protein
LLAQLIGNPLLWLQIQWGSIGINRDQYGSILIIIIILTLILILILILENNNNTNHTTKTNTTTKNNNISQIL